MSYKVTSYSCCPSGATLVLLMTEDAKADFRLTLYDIFQIYPDNREKDDVFITGYTLDGYHTPIDFPFTVTVSEVKSRYNASELGLKPTSDSSAYNGFWVGGFNQDAISYYKKNNPTTVNEIRPTDNVTEFYGQYFSGMKANYLVLPASTEYIANAWNYSFASKVIDFDETLAGSKSNGQLVIEGSSFAYSILEEINFPEKNLMIRASAFEASKLKKISFPKDHEVSFGDYCFASTPLKEFSFPENTVHIGNDILAHVELNALFVPAPVFNLMFESFEEGKFFDMVDNLVVDRIYIDIPSSAISEEHLQILADYTGSQIYLNDTEGFRRF